MACAKLREALFLGDFEAAHDLEFIIANKISRVINCAGRELTNQFERSGLRYLTYYWPQSGNCVIFDESNAVLDEIYSFIEEALDAGEAVLIHSTDGVSRATFCACVYFMLRYRWTLPKTLLYLQSKRPDLQPQQGFMRQLQALDASLQRVIRATSRGPSDPAIRRCAEWDPAMIAKAGGGSGTGGAGAMPAGGDLHDSDDDDELLLVHTFLNSQPVSEDVIMAAQSGAPLARSSLGALSHTQGSVHFPPGFSSASVGGGRGARTGGGGARSGGGGGGGALSWIDDHARTGTAHRDVPVSPGTKRATLERPPTASYNSLALGHGWLDAAAIHSEYSRGGAGGGVTTAFSVHSANGATTVASVMPTASGTISAAAAQMPRPFSSGTLAEQQPGRVKSILRGSRLWSEQLRASTSSSSTLLVASSGAGAAPASASGLSYEDLLGGVGSSRSSRRGSVASQQGPDPAPLYAGASFRLQPQLHTAVSTVTGAAYGLGSAASGGLVSTMSAKSLQQAIQPQGQQPQGQQQQQQQLAPSAGSDGGSQRALLSSHPALAGSGAPINRPAPSSQPGQQQQQAQPQPQLAPAQSSAASSGSGGTGLTMVRQRPPSAQPPTAADAAAAAVTSAPAAATLRAYTTNNGSKAGSSAAPPALAATATTTSRPAGAAAAAAASQHAAAAANPFGGGSSYSLEADSASVALLRAQDELLRRGGPAGVAAAPAPPVPHQPAAQRQPALQPQLLVPLPQQQQLPPQSKPTAAAAAPFARTVGGGRDGARTMGLSGNGPVKATSAALLGSTAAMTTTGGGSLLSAYLTMHAGAGGGGASSGSGRPTSSAGGTTASSAPHAGSSLVGSLRMAPAGAQPLSAFPAASALDGSVGGGRSSFGGSSTTGGAAASSYLPSRSASNRVRGYSPGPGKSRSSSAAASAPLPLSSAPGTAFSTQGGGGGTATTRQQDVATRLSSGGSSVNNSSFSAGLSGGSSGSLHSSSAPLAQQHAAALSAASRGFLSASGGASSFSGGAPPPRSLAAAGQPQAQPRPLTAASVGSSSGGGAVAALSATYGAGMSSRRDNSGPHARVAPALAVGGRPSSAAAPSAATAAVAAQPRGSTPVRGRPGSAGQPQPFGLGGTYYAGVGGGAQSRGASPGPSAAPASAAGATSSRYRAGSPSAPAYRY